MVRAPRRAPPGGEAVTRRRRRLAAAAIALALAAAPVAARQTTFRTTTAVVSVSVSVKRGNNVVANLKAADFMLTDNGVRQTVEAVSIESVPIDVTLFLDTSGRRRWCSMDTCGSRAKMRAMYARRQLEQS